METWKLFSRLETALETWRKLRWEVWKPAGNFLATNGFQAGLRIEKNATCPIQGASQLRVMTLKEAAQILELNPPFSREDLKKAFRDALMVWHPDRFPEGTERRAKAEKRTQQVNDAYDLLCRLPDSDFPICGEGWTESTVDASPPKRTVREPSGMSSKRFSILIAAGILCTLLFSAPGLYRLSKDYEKDRVQEWQRISKNGTWHEITRRDEYQSLTGRGKLELKTRFFDQRIAVDPRFAKFSPETQKAIEIEFWNTPDDTGQGYVTSMLGSAARGMVAVIPWCFDELATWQISSGFTEFAKSVRGVVEGFFSVNPVLVEKWPLKLAFWLGFASPPAAFFVIRTRRRNAARLS